MFVTYKLSEKSFNKLQKIGISEAALKNLAEMENMVFSSQDAFLSRVSKLPLSKEIMGKKDDLLKVAKGFMRLDLLIPNRTIREWTEALIFAIVVATFVRTYFFTRLIKSLKFTTAALLIKINNESDLILFNNFLSIRFLFFLVTAAKT